jgi:hypothetical protein
MKVYLNLILLSLLASSAYAIEATHGMVLFGQQKLMAYHLPMFHKIHAKQIVLEFATTPELKAELSERQQNGELLTFVPVPFDLDKFLASPHALKGDIYLGHFEKDGVVIHESITMNVKEILMNEKLTKNNGSGLNNYRLVGTDVDSYAIHMLDGGTHQDQIFKVFADSNLPLLKKFIDSNQLITKTNGLFSKGERVMLTMDYQIDRSDPKCYPLVTRACQLSPIAFEAILKDEVFSDSVM